MRFALLHLLFAALFSFPSLADDTASWHCVHQVVSEIFVDPDPTQYSITSSRSLKSVNKMHNGFILEDLKHLPPGAVILDPGAGWGTTGIELAQKGYQVHAVNLQDFHRLLKDAVGAEHPRFVSAGEGRLLSVNGISARNLKALSEALEITPQKPLEFTVVGFGDEALHIPQVSNPIEVAHESKKLIVQIVEKLNELKQKKLFDYRVGTVQSYLSSLPDHSIDRFYETFGAYYYSRDRVKILKGFWSKMKEGAIASINVSGMTDQFIYEGGSSIAFEEWLVKNYPETFSFSSGLKSRGRLLQPKVVGVPQLMMKKTTKTFPIPNELEQRYIGEFRSTSPYSTVEIPRLEYRLLGH